MKLSVGNEKLGPAVLTLSRSVGPTCPSTCPLLGAGCYAEKIQTRRPNVRAAWAANVGSDVATVYHTVLASLRKHARKHGTVLFRLHVAGDFLLADQLDRPYLAGLLSALRTAKAEGLAVRAWVYTRAWDILGSRYRALLSRLGVQVFASVFSSDEAGRAAALGYRLAHSATVGDVPSGWHTVAARRAFTCLEQTHGVSCQDCGYCFRAKDADVVFLKH